jgi:hypothetical protein
MELFAITCTTCKTRLNVRDPAAIGQILACPKCGGMVMVKPPPAFSEVGEQRSDLPTATEVEGPALDLGRTPNSSAFDGLDELLSDVPPRVQRPQPPTAATPPAAPTIPKPRFVGGPPVHRSSTPPVPKSSATPSGPIPTPTKPPPAAKPTAANHAGAEPRPRKRSASSGEIPAPPAESAVPPAPETVATPARPRTNYWLLMSASIVLGIGLALIGVCAVILLRPTTPRIAQAPTTAKNPSAVAERKQTPSAAGTSIAPQTAPTPQPEPPSTETPIPAEPPVSETVRSTENAPATDDPPGLTKPPATSAPKPATNPTTDSLAKFDSLIGGPDNDPLAKPAPLASADSNSPPAVDATPVRPLAPRPPPREIDIAKCLAMPLLGIETSNAALADFVQLISDLSTIPITLDVPFPPATPQSLVTLKATNTTVGKALSEALAPLPLEYVISDDQLIIRRPEPNPFAALTHDVKDLTSANEQQIGELVELLRAVVEPGSWGDSEGQGSISIDVAKGTITIRNRRVVQFQVLIALEKLRASHVPPLPPKAKMDPAYIKLDSRLKQAGPRLAKPISLNYGQPTRLVTIFDRLGEASGMRILVDWHDVARAGWNPAGEGTLVVNNQPLVAALEALLNPLDLTVRIVDAQTLQVVTPAGLADREELEVYKMADLLSNETTAETLVAKIRSALGDEAFISSGGSGEIRFDDNTKCLLAWLPQLRQWQLEALLTEWREKKK